MRPDKEQYTKAMALAMVLATEALEVAGDDPAADAYHVMIDALSAFNHSINEVGIRPWIDYGDDGSRPEARFKELSEEELKKMQPYPFPKLYNELKGEIEHCQHLHCQMQGARYRCPELSQQLTVVTKAKADGEETVEVGTHLVNVPIPIDAVISALKREYEKRAELAAGRLETLREALLEAVDTIDFMMAAKRVGIPDIANSELEL